jgi:hypothetical protein
MELKNRRGGGTTVTVTLPAAPDGKLSRAGEGVAPPAAATAMERKR